METEDQRNKRRYTDYYEGQLVKNIKKIQDGKDDNLIKERFLTLIREGVDKADSKFHDCISTTITTDHKSNCYSDYGRDIRDLNLVIDGTKSLGKNKSFYLPCIPERIDDETNSIIKETNEKVSERTSYGRRNELAEHNSLVLTWSNNSKAWYPTAKAKKGETVDLDANMILLKETKDKTKLGHAASCLQSFPLYGLSFEAIHKRKETPLLEGTAMWVERQLSKEKEIEERRKYA